MKEPSTIESIFLRWRYFILHLCGFGIMVYVLFDAKEFVQSFLQQEAQQTQEKLERMTTALEKTGMRTVAASDKTAQLFETFATQFHAQVEIASSSIVKARKYIGDLVGVITGGEYSEPSLAAYAFELLQFIESQPITITTKKLLSGKMDVENNETGSQWVASHRHLALTYVLSSERIDDFLVRLCTSLTLFDFYVGAEGKKPQKLIDYIKEVHKPTRTYFQTFATAQK